ncbi:hypothetical protein FOA52_012289 [Chlamydomonas sp. UWO 241]|nr:hypothetical protein FOA52_012289 [Chlamydomonas sp. UWO 241]
MKSGLAHSMIDFINQAWTPYHAVEEASKRLLQAGYQHITEKGAWDVQPGGKYFFTRNYSTIVAFAVGEKFQPGNGFYMIGAHTDSPCLKTKPVTKGSKAGYQMVNVQPYGGGLWHTWFDRDLGIAGRVLVRGVAADGTNCMVHRLVKIDRPILRVPMLAIHLQKDLYTDGFKPNLQNNLAPVLATAAKAALGLDSADAPATGEAAKHHASLLDLVAKEAGCSAADIVDFELSLCDVQPGQIGGIKDEFVFIGRLDNLAMSFMALQSLIDTTCDGALVDETGVRSIALFDHEEIGSSSAQGAGGPVMRDTITRVARALSGGEGDAIERSMRASFLVSADMAHALHPNYADKHDGEHQPRFHEGLVLKHNASQRYATNAVSASLFREVARRRGIPCQEFCVRNDMPCGSTIGPILSSLLGCRTVDCGVPMLSMHSIREMCGTDDIDIGYNHFVAFFEEISKLDATFDVDSLPPPELRGTLDDMPCDHTAHPPREAPHPGLAKPSS